MELGFLGYEVAELCLGKPPLRSISAFATVGEALAALKSSPDNFITVWSCDHSSPKRKHLDCICVGKVCMVDIICFLCRHENVASPALAFKSPLSLLLPHLHHAMVKHVHPSSSLLDAIDMILEGAQNLVVPIKSRERKKSSSIHNGQEYCWLTQEDLIRFLLSSIGLFSPIATLSIDTLAVITADYPVVNYHSAATSAVGAISLSLLNQTSLAVVDEGGALIGEISPFTLSCCDETVAAAVMTLSSGDLMAYIDCGGPPEEVVRMVEERLRKEKLDGMLEELWNSPEEEEGPRVGWHSRCRRTEAIVCQRRSSLVAVMIQAIAHRVNYVWVVEDDGAPVGIVTFASILEVFRFNLENIID